MIVQEIKYVRRYLDMNREKDLYRIKVRHLRGARII